MIENVSLLIYRKLAACVIYFRNITVINIHATGILHPFH